MELRRLKFGPVDLALGAFALVLVLMLQFMHDRHEKDFLDEIDSGRALGEEYKQGDRVLFTVYIQPLGLWGFTVFDSVMVVDQSNAPRRVFVTRFRSDKATFLRILHHVADYELTKGRLSFDGLLERRDIVTSQSGCKSLRCLFALDIFFAVILVSIVGTVFRQLPKHKLLPRCSAVWQYCLVALGLVLVCCFFVDGCRQYFLI